MGEVEQQLLLQEQCRKRDDEYHYLHLPTPDYNEATSTSSTSISISFSNPPSSSSSTPTKNDTNSTATTATNTLALDLSRSPPRLLHHPSSRSSILKQRLPLSPSHQSLYSHHRTPSAPSTIAHYNSNIIISSSLSTSSTAGITRTPTRTRNMATASTYLSLHAPTHPHAFQTVSAPGTPERQSGLRRSGASSTNVPRMASTSTTSSNATVRAGAESRGPEEGGSMNVGGGFNSLPNSPSRPPTVRHASRSEKILRATLAPSSQHPYSSSSNVDPRLQRTVSGGIMPLRNHHHHQTQNGPSSQQSTYYASPVDVNDPFVGGGHRRRQSYGAPATTPQSHSSKRQFQEYGPTTTTRPIDMGSNPNLFTSIAYSGTEGNSRAAAGLSVSVSPSKSILNGDGGLGGLLQQTYTAPSGIPQLPAGGSANSTSVSTPKARHSYTYSQPTTQPHLNSPFNGVTMSGMRSPCSRPSSPSPLGLRSRNASPSPVRSRAGMTNANLKVLVPNGNAPSNTSDRSRSRSHSYSRSSSRRSSSSHAQWDNDMCRRGVDEESDSEGEEGREIVPPPHFNFAAGSKFCLGGGKSPISPLSRRTSLHSQGQVLTMGTNAVVNGKLLTPPPSPPSSSPASSSIPNYLSQPQAQSQATTLSSSGSNSASSSRSHSHNHSPHSTSSPSSPSPTSAALFDPKIASDVLRSKEGYVSFAEVMGLRLDVDGVEGGCDCCSGGDGKCRREGGEERKRWWSGVGGLIWKSS
ncbi:uncharacterized protein EI90DRAFT_3116063 [Cantharellus anzutake]|uniref:uncharacterized protein n=1 Tax=Cantharellus anzutake TaxID=1750568 RepID=UPI0019085BD0|nr:uncharacterized protein EI90DRAFT_3116063 [Cantharellus anzutake]KAF8342160.1 hypothetical protein EI90DRAFT_3116063 [Cantharellus anzutake]